MDFNPLPTVEKVIDIKVDRMPMMGRYKGWYRARIGSGTYLTPNKGDELTFQTLERDVMENWCNGIQRNAQMLRQFPAPPYRHDALHAVLWVERSTGRIMTSYAADTASLNGAMPGHALIGLSRAVKPEIAQMLLAGWILAWIEDLSGLPSNTMVAPVEFLHSEKNGTKRSDLH